MAASTFVSCPLPVEADPDNERRNINLNTTEEYDARIHWHDRIHPWHRELAYPVYQSFTNCTSSLPPTGPTVYPSSCSRLNVHPLPCTLGSSVRNWLHIVATSIFISKVSISTEFRSARARKDTEETGVGDYAPSKAKLLPKHILPPLPNAQNHRCISFNLSSSSTISAFSSTSHRSGIQHSGLGNTSGLRCKLYA